MEKDPRKAYWNDKYVEYWRSRVEEAGVGQSAVIAGDRQTEGDEIYEKVFEAHPFIPGRILDVGCAWGRHFPIFAKNNLKVSGIDISGSMIDAAKGEWGEHPAVDQLIESAAESTPFADGMFDNLVCLAVFDATWQDKSITEFLRVTRPGANLYITGKNTDYFDDDELAYAAELGARKKGHPNFFTETDKLVNALTSGGHELIDYYLFPRRGDFSEFSFTRSLDSPYYEFFLVIRRGAEATEVTSISDEYSRTWRRRQANLG